MGLVMAPEELKRWVRIGAVKTPYNADHNIKVVNNKQVNNAVHGVRNKNYQLFKNRP